MTLQQKRSARFRRLKSGRVFKFLIPQDRKAAPIWLKYHNVPILVVREASKSLPGVIFLLGKLEYLDSESFLVEDSKLRILA